MFSCCRLVPALPCHVAFLQVSMRHLSPAQSTIVSCPLTPRGTHRTRARWKVGRKLRSVARNTCQASATGAVDALAARPVNESAKASTAGLASFPLSKAGVHDKSSNTVLILVQYMLALTQSEPFVAMRLVLALLSMVTAKVAGLAVPFQFKRAIDCLASIEITNSVKSATAGRIAVQAMLLHGGAKLLSTLAHELRHGIFAKAGHRVGRRVTSSSFAHLHALETAFHASSRTGALTRIIDRGNRSVFAIFRSVIFSFLPSAIELVLVSTILFRKFSLSVVAILLATFLIYILWSLLISRVLAAVRVEMNVVDNDVSARLTDSLLNSDVVSLFDNASLELSRFDTSLAKYEILAVKNDRLYVLQNVLQSWIFTVGLGSILVKCVLDVTQGRMTVGDLVMVSSLLHQMWYPLQFIGWQFRETRQALVDLANLFAIMRRQPRITDAANAKPLQVSRGEIRFENVSFAYPSSEESSEFTGNDVREESQDVKVQKGSQSWQYDTSSSESIKSATSENASVQNLSFTIPAGKTVALVGATGSGKSSVLRLLTRMYDVTEGRILIDDQNISEVTLSSLRSAICVVPQDTMLWNDTIEYNIRYGRPEASFDEIVEAAKAAAIHDTILRMPRQYFTVVGERGVRMSGGERQRVAAARAFLRSKSGQILLQDEATSALDSKTEEEVTQALNLLGVDRTRVVVAHRLSTIFDADIIYVMRYGRIVEQGSHEELLQIPQGIYADMWRRQSSAVDSEGLEKVVNVNLD